MLVKRKTQDKETKRRANRGEDRAVRGMHDRRENEKIRLNTLIRVMCLVVLIIVTRTGVAADTWIEETADKTMLRIVLRPEKEEGEPDPDLTDEIRVQIQDQIGNEDPELVSRLCDCVLWSYAYDDEVTPPGINRKPGESEIFLSFSEDPEYAFENPEDTYEMQEAEMHEEAADQEEFFEAADTEIYEETGEPEEYFEAEEAEIYEEAGESEEYFEAEETEIYEETGEPEEYFEAEETDIYEGNLEQRNEDAEIECEELRSFLTTRPREEESTEKGDSGEEKSSDSDAVNEDRVKEAVEEEAGESADAENTTDAENTAGTAEIQAEEYVGTDTEPEEYFEVNTTEENILPEEKPDMEEESTDAETISEAEPAETSAADVQEGTKTSYVPQAVADSVTEMIQGQDTRYRTGYEISTSSGTGPGLKNIGAEIKTGRQVQLLRTDSSNTETDLTEMYREALAEEDPDRLDWETLLAPLPVNDGTYILRTTETDNSGEKNVSETAFSVNRFGSVYTYNKAVQDLRGKVVKEVSSPLVISEYNPDVLEPDSWNLELTLDSRPVSQVLYTVSRKEAQKDIRTEEDIRTEAKEDGTSKSKWNCYDYVIPAENFREDGIYRLSVSSRDAAGNTSEMNRHNGGEIVFTVDGSPPELQTVQGLEKSFVNGIKAEVRVTAFDTVGLARVAAFVDGKCMASENTFSNRHRAELTFSIPRGEEQNVRIVAEDTAGNILDTDEKTAANTYAFRPSYPFARKITVRPDVLKERPEQPHTGLWILILMIIVCSGASGGLLWHTFRKDSPEKKALSWDPDPD